MLDLTLPNHVYVTLIVLALVATYFLISRATLGRAIQRAGLFTVSALTGLMLVATWLDISSGALQPRAVVVRDSGEIVLRQEFGGHYFATVEVNGVPIRMVIDTGATDLVLTQEDARRVGLAPENLAYTGRAFTANGSVATAPVRLDEVVLGGLEQRSVPAVVNGGEMFDSLLGMRFLNRFESIEIRSGELILRP